MYTINNAMGGYQCDMYYFINVKKVYFHIKRHPSTHNYASSCSILELCKSGKNLAGACRSSLPRSHF